MPAQFLHEWFHFRSFPEEWLAEHPGTPVLDIIRKWNSFRDDPDIQKVFGTANGVLMLLPIWREVPFSVSHDLELKKMFLFIVVIVVFLCLQNMMLLFVLRVLPQ